MSSEAGRTCLICGWVAPNITEHSVHVSLGHPELNRRERSARRAAGRPSSALRPVSCWRCAADINTTDGNVTCGQCGWTHPTFAPDRGEGAGRFRQEYPSVTDLDHRGRPL